METWKPVPGFDKYEVSDHGRVRSLPTPIGHYKGVTYTRHGNILRGSRTKQGPLHVSLFSPDRRKTSYISTLVATVFIGPRPHGHIVKHRDGDHANLAASNLFYTPKKKAVSCLAKPRAWFNI